VESAQGDPRPSPSGEVVAPGKILRLTGMVDAFVAELHLTPVDALDAHGLWERYDTILIEVGSALSDPLLEELARLVSSASQRSPDQLHVAVAQLAGWLHGLASGLATAQVPFLLAPVLDTDAA
jgi:Protein of unknown function (DUF2587)